MILLNKASNKIINGAMDYWQRNSTFTNPSSGTYFADRFLVFKASSASMNIARNTDVPTLEQSAFSFQYSALVTVTSSASMGVNDYYGFLQRIEGLIFSPLAGKKITLSFWVKSSVVGVYPVSFANGAENRTYTSTYVINSANTWERKTITLTHDTTGSWIYNTGNGLQVLFGLGGGTNRNTPALNTWQPALYSSHSSCVNFLGTNGATFKITGIQLEEGTEASNFERAGGVIDNEYRLCQRYFELVDCQLALPNQPVISNTVPSYPFPILESKRVTPTVSNRSVVVGGTGWSLGSIAISSNGKLVVVYLSNGSNTSAYGGPTGLVNVDAEL